MEALYGFLCIIRGGNRIVFIAMGNDHTHFILLSYIGANFGNLISVANPIPSLHQNSSIYGYDFDIFFSPS